MHEARSILGDMQVSGLRHPHGGFEPLACPVWRPTLRRIAALVGFIAFSSPTLAAGPITLEKAYPAWSNIIVAGHSQGGGHAAFLGLNLPNPVKRVVMLSAPNDNFTPPATLSNPTPDPQSASWITGFSTTPVTSFWGLRNSDEGTFGSFVDRNWQALGGGGMDGSLNQLVVGGGDQLANVDGHHRLVTNMPGSNSSSLARHNSTAANCLMVESSCLATQGKVKASWNYLLSGGYNSDQ